MNRIGILLLFLVLLLHTHGPAQQYVLTNYSLEEGVPQSSVIAIYQDFDGNIWFGTQGGVSKYNGHKFENFDSRHGLAGNHITAIFQDNMGRYWLGHRYKGITVLHQKEFIKLDLTEERINCIQEDSSGNLWIGTFGKGIYILPSGREPAVENFVKLKIRDDIVDFEVFDICFTSGYALVGTDRGLFYLKYDASFLNIDLEIFTPDNSSLPVKEFFSFELKDNVIWAMGKEGLVKMMCTENDFSPEKNTFFPFQKEIDIYFLLNITIDKNDVIWGVHSQGVYQFKDGKFNFDFYGTNYRNNKTNTIFSDKEGNVWIGTMNLGVMKYSDDKFRVYNEESGLVNNVVISVIEDSRGGLWASTEGGVCRYDGSTYEYFTEQNVLPDNSVQVLFEDSRGNIWFGYYGEQGLFRYNPATKTFRKYTEKDGLITSSVLTIAEDQNGSVWFATLGYGVSKYTYPSGNNTGKFETYTKEDGLCSNSFWIIHTDRDGNLWFGSDSDGLSMFDGTRFYTYNERDGLSNLSPAAITHDSQNNLWIGSIGGGIFKFDGHKFINYSIDKGLSSESPFSIICDNNDKVWIGTNIGIDRFDPENETFKSYGREDGFLGIENNQNSICKGKDGVIWFGTMNGIIRFDPSKDKLNAIAPVTRIENIRLFFNEFDYTQHAGSINPVTGLPSNLALRHNLNHLTFECIGISHKAPEKIKYQYRLENFDTEWNPVTDATSITYTNVPPGDYTFLVKSCNNDGIWIAEPAKIPITIFPPIWQTWWFRILAGIFTLGVLYGIFWSRLKSIKGQKVKLQGLVDEKTVALKHEAHKRKAAQVRAEESDKLKTAFLANMSHEIRTPLNAIIGFSNLLKDSKLSEVDRQIYLDYIIAGGKSLMTLINDIIDISKIEAGEVRVSNEPCNLENLLAESFMTFYEEIKQKETQEIELKLVKPDNKIKTDILTDPFRLKQILYNLLNNAIKFTEKGSITFGYKIQDENNLHFFVKDTGIGIPVDKMDVIFQRFRQVEDAYTRNYDGTGLGLTISRKLSRLMGGDMWVESVSGEGSTFSFTIPFEMTGTKKEFIMSESEIVLSESIKGKNILVVEDEDTNYVLIENMLQDYDLNIIRADDGLQAVDVFRQNGRQIDLVLMDIKIPKLNGYEATKEIKKIKSEVPIVAQTAYAMVTEKQNCLDAGCDDYISKPFNKQELLSIIQKNISNCNTYY